MKIQSILVILVIVATGLLSACTKSKNTVKKEIGIQLYSLKEDMKKDPVATIQALGKMGYSFVELADYENGKMYGMEPAEFKALCGTNGLQVLSSHKGLDVPDATAWDQSMAWWDSCIVAHKAVGARFIVKPSMGDDAYESLETLKRYCAYYNVIGKKCNEAGIRFGYHNHDKEFTTEFDGKAVYDHLLENTQSEFVMFQLDLYWISKGGGNPLEYFQKYPGRFELWHIKDDAEVGASGKIDFASIYAAKEISGMKYGIVEVEPKNMNPFECVKKSLEFLNQAEYVK